MATNIEQLSEDIDCSATTVLKASDIFNKCLITSGLSKPSQYQRNDQTRHAHKQLDVTLYGEVGGVRDICGCGLFEQKAGDSYTMCSSLLRNKDEANEQGPQLMNDAKVIENVNVSHEWKEVDKERNKGLFEALLTSRSLVLDSTGMCMNALQTAVLSACALLKIGQVMENF